MGTKKPYWQRTQAPQKAIPTSPSGAIRNSINVLVENFDTVLIVLGVFHLIFFLIVLAAIGQLNSKAALPQTFGEQPENSAPIVMMTKAEQKSQTMFHTVLYGSYTALIWAGLLWKRKKLERQFRFMVMMVTPGSLVTLFLIYRTISFW